MPLTFQAAKVVWSCGDGLAVCSRYADRRGFNCLWTTTGFSLFCACSWWGIGFDNARCFCRLWALRSVGVKGLLAVRCLTLFKRVRAVARFSVSLLVWSLWFVFVVGLSALVWALFFKV